MFCCLFKAIQKQKEGGKKKKKRATIYIIKHNSSQIEGYLKAVNCGKQHIFGSLNSSSSHVITSVYFKRMIQDCLTET